jgi:virulence-associated protein VagC
VKTSLVRIGNSRGIRIPKRVIEQCGFDERVEMRLGGQSLVITPVREPGRLGRGLQGHGGAGRRRAFVSGAFRARVRRDRVGMAASLRRFQIWLVSLDPTQGSEIRKSRPCVIGSPEEMNSFLRTVASFAGGVVS